MADSNYSDPDLDEEDEEERDEDWKPEEQMVSPSSGGVSTPTAALYRSVCQPSTAAMYACIYKVPPEYKLRSPAEEERAHAPPLGYAAIYTHHFQNGLRLPLPPFVVAVLAYYRISLAQLHPNCIITLLGFMGMCKQESIVPTTILFRHFFRLQRAKQCTEGWYTFQPRGAKIVSGQSGCLDGWKTSFLFFKTAPFTENPTLNWRYSPIEDMPIGESERLSEQIVSKLKRKRVECEDLDILDKLLEKYITRMASDSDASMASVTRMQMIEADTSTQTTHVSGYSDPQAAVYRSICTSIKAKHFSDTYKVPPEFGLCAPTPDQRAHVPPPGYASIYTHHFQYGLRLPLPPFVVSVLAHYKIALTQLHPNCIISLIGFMEICKKVSIAPTPTLFRHFFQLGRHHNLKEGWYTFHQRLPKIVQGQPSRVGGWKKSFLFFKTAPITGNLTLSWNYSYITDPPLPQHGRPSAATVKKFLDNVFVYQMPLPAERMVEASILKSCRSKNKVSAEKPSKENEPPTDVSTESLNAATKECVDGSPQVPSVPSLKDLSPEQFSCFIYLLQGDKEDLEQVVETMKQGIKDKDSEIASLRGDKEELEKVVAAKDKEIALLKSKNSSPKSAGDVSIKDKGSEVGSLEGDTEELDKVLAAMERNVKVKDKEIALLKSENSRLKNVSDDRGPLLNVYTWKLLKTRAFARFLEDLRTSVMSLGRHEAVEQMRDRYPDTPEEAFVGLEDPLASSKLKNQFLDMIQDDGFEFPLLDHLLSLAEIPCSYQLRDLEVDEDKDSLISLKS